MVQCFSRMGTVLVDLLGVIFVSVALGVGRDKQEWLLMDLFLRRLSWIVLQGPPPSKGRGQNPQVLLTLGFRCHTVPLPSYTSIKIPEEKYRFYLLSYAILQRLQACRSAGSCSGHLFKISTPAFITPAWLSFQDARVKESSCTHRDWDFLESGSVIVISCLDIGGRCPTKGPTGSLPLGSWLSPIAWETVPCLLFFIAPNSASWLWFPLRGGWWKEPGFSLSGSGERRHLCGFRCQCILV